MKQVVYSEDDEIAEALEAHARSVGVKRADVVRWATRLYVRELVRAGSIDRISGETFPVDGVVPKVVEPQVVP